MALGAAHRNWRSDGVSLFGLCIHLLQAPKATVLKRVLNDYVVLTSAVQAQGRDERKKYEQRYA